MQIRGRIKLMCVAALAITLQVTSIRAAVPIPVSFWDFNNSNGQALGSFDGVADASGGVTPIDLNIKQFNSPGGWAQSFFTGVLDNASPVPMGSGHPIEHYVPSGATFLEAGLAYHMQGGTRREYSDPSTGLADLDAIDPQTQTIFRQGNDIFAYREVMEPEPLENADGAFDATTSYTYSFWLNVLGAGSFDPKGTLPIVHGALGGSRYGSEYSHLLSRATSSGSLGGSVTIGYSNTLSGVDFFNFRFRGDAGLTPDYVTSSTILAGRDTWSHYVIQFDMMANSVTIWQDGGAVSETLSLGVGAIHGDFRLNNVAYSNAAQRESGDFQIDDLAIWTNTPLDILDVQRLYQYGVAKAIAMNEFLSADFDRDGDVDGDDFLTWQAGFGVNAMGDADGDGDTDGDDFLIWQSQFGSGAAAAARANRFTPSEVPIPEPAAWVLLMLAAGLLRVAPLVRFFAWRRVA